MKPELIAFSEYKLGGVQSFYYNLLNNDPDNYFEKKWVLADRKGHTGAKPPSPYNLGEKTIQYNPAHGRWRAAWPFHQSISNINGLVLVNQPPELDSLYLYPKQNKTIFHLVHDILYIDFAKDYQHIIDVFITHNLDLYNKLLEAFPDRKEKIFYLPFGVTLSTKIRIVNINRPLHIAFIARLHKDKGVYDLLKIDDLLKKSNIDVRWTITGDGPEKDNFLKEIKHRSNFAHVYPSDLDALYQVISECDIYLLPSVLDGTPVSLLESLSVGLVPIVYKFNNGIENIIPKDVGYIVSVGNMQEVADIIENLHHNRGNLEERSKAAIALARTKYEAKERAKDYYNLFKKYQELKEYRKIFIPKIPAMIENPQIPFWLAELIRKTRIKLKI